MAFEALGIAVFVYGIQSSGGSNFYIACALLAGIIVAAPVSGAHLNPSITLALYLKKNNPIT